MITLGQRVHIKKTSINDEAIGTVMSAQIVFENIRKGTKARGYFVMIDGVVPVSSDIDYPGCYEIDVDLLTPIEGTDPMDNIMRYDEAVFSITV